MRARYSAPSRSSAAGPSPDDSSSTSGSRFSVGGAFLLLFLAGVGVLAFDEEMSNLLVLKDLKEHLRTGAAKASALVPRRAGAGGGNGGGGFDVNNPSPRSRSNPVRLDTTVTLPATQSDGDGAVSSHHVWDTPEDAPIPKVAANDTALVKGALDTEDFFAWSRVEPVCDVTDAEAGLNTRSSLSRLNLSADNAIAQVWYPATTQVRCSS